VTESPQPTAGPGIVARVRAAFGRFASTRAGTVAGVGALIILSAALRVRGLGIDYWIDEGLSVGIGSHPFLHIPGLLRQDGSPPLYYMMLHVWMAWFGTGEWATQSLSAIFALATVPAAFWAGDKISGRRAAWAGAALAAVNPFLTIHSYEARMYALMTLLGLLTSAAFVLAFAQRRPRWRIPFGVLLALMLYTHNWGLFFAAACVAAVGWLAWKGEPNQRRNLMSDALVGFGTTIVLYLPWVPTLIFQAIHTGAPWALRPSPYTLLYSSANTFGGPGQLAALVLVGGTALAAFAASRQLRQLRSAQALLIIGLGTVLLAWLGSIVSPAWADRYLAVALGPVILFAAVALTNAERLGLVAFAIIFVLSAIPQPIKMVKPGDEAVVAQYLKPWLRPGDEVIVTHPERTPIMRHYLGPQFHYADLFGPVKDPQIFDWRDALDRMKAVSATADLQPMLDAVPVHGRILMVRPIVDVKARSWKAPWTFRVKSQARHWAHVINDDPRFRPLMAWPQPYGNLKIGVRGVVYEKIHN
jgi:mannosyltransferase